MFDQHVRCCAYQRSFFELRSMPDRLDLGDCPERVQSRVRVYLRRGRRESCLWLRVCWQLRVGLGVVSYVRCVRYKFIRRSRKLCRELRAVPDRIVHVVDWCEHVQRGNGLYLHWGW